MLNSAHIKKDLRSGADAHRAEILQRFFKTGKGEYGEGDIFLGLTVPQVRKVAFKYEHLHFKEIKKLLDSEVHEERLAALLILIYNFQNNKNLRGKIFKFYLKNTKNINNWDLVDVSADKIAGGYLLNKPKEILYKLAKSENLWERRISMIATFQFVKNNKFSDTLKISEILLNDKHDLIHKTVGWMLREVGKQSQETEEKFLKKHYKEMPRTMLRYAIEKFPKRKRRAYLKGII